jgi:hypothetical protein
VGALRWPVGRKSTALALQENTIDFVLISRARLRPAQQLNGFPILLTKKAKVCGGRWFEDPKTKEIWRLVPPDYPFRGLWERINVNQTEF